MDNCKVSNINQSSEVEKEREYQEWKKRVLESRKNSCKIASSSSNSSSSNVNRKKRKLKTKTIREAQGDGNNMMTNDEKVPNKKAKNTLPVKEKQKSVEKEKGKRQPTIDFFANFLLKNG